MRRPLLRLAHVKVLKFRHRDLASQQRVRDALTPASVHPGGRNSVVPVNNEGVVPTG